MSLISELKTAEQKAVSFLVTTAKEIENNVLPILKNAEANSSTIEAITALISPQAAKVEVAGYALLGVAITAIEAAEAAGNAGGINISLDSATVSDIKALIPAVKAIIPTLK